MKIRRFMAYLLIGGCVTVVVLFVAMRVLAGIALRNDPRLEADIRIWQEAYDGLAALPDFAYVSARDDGSFLLHNVGGVSYTASVKRSVFKSRYTDFFKP